jgi:DNA primase
VNPYAQELTFLDDQTRTRRDHMKYLVLIRTVTLLRQYQKRLQRSSWGGQSKEYIEVEPEDIEVANRLAHEALGRSLDELPPQTRRLVALLHQMVRQESARAAVAPSEYRFSRRDVRRFCGWSYEQVRVHLERLVQLEYVLVHRGGRGQSFVYELLYGGEGLDGKPFVMGLLDVEALRRKGCAEAMAEGLGGDEESLGGGSGVHCGPIGAGLGGGWDPCEPRSDGPSQDKEGKGVKIAHLETTLEMASPLHAARNGSGLAKGA